MARKILEGLAVSPGIAVAPILISGVSGFYEKHFILEDMVPAEINSIDQASATVKNQLLKSLSSIPPTLNEYREMVSAQLELAQDTKIIDGAKARVRQRKICAAWAIAETVEELTQLFKDLPDPYLSERAQDIASIGKSLIHSLAGIQIQTTPNQPSILAAPDLSPSEIIDNNLAIKGIAIETGGLTSHTAILARGLKIPALVNVADLAKNSIDGELAIIDGLQGKLLLGPDAEDVSRYKLIKKNYDNFETESQRAAHLPAKTINGVRISVLANLERPTQIDSLADFGAEGVGLYRTEFSFLSGSSPDEDSLAHEYSQIVNGAFPQSAVIRTLDTGADKLLPAQEALHEPNPALGLRGIRFCLKYLDLFKMQLRAILRAGYPNPAAIMLPMISTLEELRAVKKLLAEIKRDLKNKGIPHAANHPLGVMIETPAAVMICDALAQECDFLSIGTNDLLHYIMAIDRGNRHVAYLSDPFHPAFIRAIKNVVEVAHKNAIKVSVCGEMAADASGIALLLGLGVDILSAAPRFVPAIKYITRRLNTHACANVAQNILKGASSKETRAALNDLLNSALGAELPFNNAFISPGQQQ